MLKKFIILLISTLLIYSCEYTPIYSDKNTGNFEISNFRIEGESQINEVIQNRLSKYFNTNSGKKYVVSIITDYEKNSAVKDVTGKTTSFKLVVNLNLIYNKVDPKENNKEKSITFSEKQIIKREQNNYDQNNYENILIKNMSELIIDKVILHLARI